MINKTLGDYGHLVLEKISAWLELSAKMLPNLLLAIIVFSSFFLISRLVRSFSRKAFSKITDQRAIIELFSKVLTLAVVAVGFFMALSILKLDKAVTSLLAGAGVLGLALGFAFQEIATNFVSGILISFERPYAVGDIVEVGSYVGEVTQIDLRVTTLRTFQGLDVLVPNKQMYTSSLINYTATPGRRIDFTVGVSYGEDLPKVERVVKEALEDLEYRMEQDIGVYFKEFGDSSINMEIHVWIRYPEGNSFWATQHAMVTRLKQAFDENDIVIPFPIRTLDFGIKGGTRLREELANNN